MDVEDNDPDLAYLHGLPELDPVVEELLKGIDTRLFETTEGRKALCERDPLMFALTYLPDSITNTKGLISFAECHLEWAEVAKRWTLPAERREVKQDRHAFLAPRATGKSTWWFLIFPIWWAAYGYADFIAAFASRGDMALTHLDNFKRALKNPKNTALRQDFPNLVNHRKNTEGVYISRNGFVFKAQGIDMEVLGMKDGDSRPDTLLLDDIEPGEAKYSMYQMEQRLKTLQDDVFELNTEARVCLSGTTTMPNSITHQMVKHAKGYDSPDLEWVGLENIQVHHSLPILTNEDGTERSFWPSNSKFSLEVMKKARHTRNFMKNYLNDPMAVDAEYWSPEDFHYETFECTKTMISIDGAVTTGKRSDFTGIAVVGYQPGSGRSLGRCLVKDAIAVKLRGEPLRAKVLELIGRYPEVNGVLVESNQGGDMWLDTLHDLPVPVLPLHNSVKKETRAGNVLALYQMPPGHVFHVAPLGALEEQMCAFPKVPNDDLVDAVGNAVLTYLRPAKKRRAKARTIIPR